MKLRKSMPRQAGSIGFIQMSDVGFFWLAANQPGYTRLGTRLGKPQLPANQPRTQE
jgi:hypothetical protein